MPEYDDDEPSPRTPLQMRCAKLLRDLNQFDELEDGPYCDPERGQFEAMLHEIAHVVVMRHGVRAALRSPPSVTVGELVPAFPDYELVHAGIDEANEHEIDTIAVEVIAAKRAGLPLEAIDIAEFAIGGDNVRDLGDAEAVTKLITAAMRRPEIRRWGNGLGDYILRGL